MLGRWQRKRRYPARSAEVAATSVEPHRCVPESSKSVCRHAADPVEGIQSAVADVYRRAGGCELPGHVVIGHDRVLVQIGFPAENSSAACVKCSEANALHALDVPEAASDVDRVSPSKDRSDHGLTSAAAGRLAPTIIDHRLPPQTAAFSVEGRHVAAADNKNCARVGRESVPVKALLRLPRRYVSGTDADGRNSVSGTTVDLPEPSGDIERAASARYQGDAVVRPRTPTSVDRTRRNDMSKRGALDAAYGIEAPSQEPTAAAIRLDRRDAWKAAAGWLREACVGASVSRPKREQLIA